MRLLSCLLLLAGLPTDSQNLPTAAPAHYCIQLIWGTNHPKPAAADYRPVRSKLNLALSHVFKWKNYWETSRQEILVAPGKPARVRLSSDCEVEVEFTSSSQRETRIYGKGILVTRSRRKIYCRNLSIHGGAIETGGSWFVIVGEEKVPAME